MFYVYEDWTTCINPWCFYVGKGNLKRIQKIKRNKYHQNIVQKYGIQRKIVFATSVEQLALDVEKQLIEQNSTYFYAQNNVIKGANFTVGGEGVSGIKFSVESKKQMSEKRKRENLSVETRQKMSLAQRNREKATIKTRMKMSKSSKGRRKSVEERTKISKALTGKKQKCTQKSAIQIDQLDNEDNLIRTHISIWSAAKHISTKASASNILYCCHKKRKNAYGYRWQFHKQNAQ
jgi:hypothetical protein